MEPMERREHCKVSLTYGRIDVQEGLAWVSSPYCGGTSLFIGTTRITENGGPESKKVQHLTYEAYEEMALATMRQIVLNITGTAADGHHRAYVCHKLGQVNLGQESILIAVSSPHRSSSHQMVMQILNEIKQKVPIWKKICFDSEAVDQNASNNNSNKAQSSHWSSNSEAFWLESK